MRVVAWNCCDGFERKFGHLERLRPDVAVVSECRPECLQYAGLTDRSYWTGAPGQKGLAIITYNGWEIASHGPQVAERWFAPVTLTRGGESLQLIGVWLNDGADYVQPTLKAWETLRPFVTASPTVLAGDFNQSVALDKDRGAGRRFADVLTKLQGECLTSAWHQHSGEAHGVESQATLYWRWQQASPFHIDYVFYPERALKLEALSIGSYEQYVAGRISDHVPIVADFSLVPLSAQSTYSASQDCPSR